MFCSCFGWIRCIGGSGLSKLFHFCFPCLSNERRHFKHFAGICGIFGSLREASRSSNSVVRASFTNEDTFGTFQAVAAVSGSLEEMSLVFLFSCPCFMNERRQKRHFPGRCGCFGFVGGNVQSLPFLLFVLHERTKTKTALSRQLWQFRVRWRKRLWSSFSVVRAS